MKPQAIALAQTRLARARRACEAAHKQLPYKDSPAGDSFREQWDSFLVAASAIFSKLEQGAKGHGKSDVWFGLKKEERANDELLRYIKQARNIEEHSVMESVEQHGLRLVPDNPYTKVVSDGSDGKPVQVSYEVGKPFSMRVLHPGPYLLPVINRGVTFNPPSKHLGEPMPDQRPITVMKLALAYLEKMIDEAKALPPH